MVLMVLFYDKYSHSKKIICMKYLVYISLYKSNGIKKIRVIYKMRINFPLFFFYVQWTIKITS